MVRANGDARPKLKVITDGRLRCSYRPLPVPRQRHRPSARRPHAAQRRRREHPRPQSPRRSHHPVRRPRWGRDDRSGRGARHGGEPAPRRVRPRHPAGGHAQHPRGPDHPEPHRAAHRHDLPAADRAGGQHRPHHRLRHPARPAGPARIARPDRGAPVRGHLLGAGPRPDRRPVPGHRHPARHPPRHPAAGARRPQPLHRQPRARPRRDQPRPAQRHPRPRPQPVQPVRRHGSGRQRPARGISRSSPPSVSARRARPRRPTSTPTDSATRPSS